MSFYIVIIQGLPATFIVLLIFLRLSFNWKYFDSLSRIAAVVHVLYEAFTTAERCYYSPDGCVDGFICSSVS